MAGAGGAIGAAIADTGVATVAQVVTTVKALASFLPKFIVLYLSPLYFSPYLKA